MPYDLCSGKDTALQTLDVRLELIVIVVCLPPRLRRRLLLLRHERLGILPSFPSIFDSLRASVLINDDKAFGYVFFLVLQLHKEVVEFKDLVLNCLH